MSPRFRPRPTVKPKLNVTTTSSKAELKQALDQARAAKIEADKSGTPQQKRKTHAKYLDLLQMQPEVFPTGKRGVSPRNLTTKERVETGNLKPIRNKSIPPGLRLRREQVSDSGNEKISDYIKRKYPKKKGGKITYKMTGGQVVAISYD